MLANKEKRLMQLLRQAGGDWVSGQYLSDELGVSRMTISKYFEELRQKGYNVETMRRRGYRLVYMPQEYDATSIQYHLGTVKMGHPLHFHAEVDSTQKIASKLVSEGTPEGTLVIAEAQTAGRGRLQRKWDSAPEKGVWMSLVLRPNIPPQRAAQLTLVAAVSVAMALETFSGVSPEIKWPNDILIGGRKVCGILTEMVGDVDRVDALIIGIGVNVTHEPTDFPENIRTLATSVGHARGKEVTRTAVVCAILEKFEQMYQRYLDEGFLGIRLLWESYSVSLGRQVRITTAQETYEALAHGLMDDGSLKVERADGTISYVYSGDVSII
ncbi:MAG: biotin--[acetyl-CoA-carboxylase] ligase [Bacilli bacterium]